MEENQNNQSLAHHGVKGQKWGVRKELERNPDERREHVLGISTGVLIGAGAGFLSSRKRYFVKGASYKDAVTKTALRTIGMSIVGGLLGHVITTSKQVYARDKALTGVEGVATRTERRIRTNPITNPVGNINRKLGKAAYKINRANQ